MDGDQVPSDAPPHAGAPAEASETGETVEESADGRVSLEESGATADDGVALLDTLTEPVTESFGSFGAGAGGSGVLSERSMTETELTGVVLSSSDDELDDVNMWSLGPPPSLGEVEDYLHDPIPDYLAQEEDAAAAPREMSVPTMARRWRARYVATRENTEYYTVKRGIHRLPSPVAAPEPITAKGSSMPGGVLKVIDREETLQRQRSNTWANPLLRASAPLNFFTFLRDSGLDYDDLEEHDLAEHELVYEYFASELRYVSDLNLAWKLYVHPLLEAEEPLLPQETFDLIFGNFAEIRAHASTAYRELSRARREDPLISTPIPMVEDLVAGLPLYPQYMVSYQQSMTVLAQATKSHPQFEALLREGVGDGPQADERTLSVLLSAPVVRFNQYVQFVDALATSNRGLPSGPQLFRLQEQVAAIEEQLHRVAIISKERKEVQEVLSQLEGLETLLTPSKSRRVLRKGDLVKHMKGGKLQTRHFVLFNDYLVWAKRRKLSRSKYVVRQAFPLSAVEVSTFDDTGKTKNAFCVRHIGNKLYVLAASSAEDRNGWLEDMLALKAARDLQKANEAVQESWRAADRRPLIEREQLVYDDLLSQYLMRGTLTRHLRSLSTMAAQFGISADETALANNRYGSADTLESTAETAAASSSTAGTSPSCSNAPTKAASSKPTPPSASVELPSSSSSSSYYSSSGSGSGSNSSSGSDSSSDASSDSA
ncbi:uncharacterized protein AMSG_01043 [Thecamonas trahens ATCC 50062]|uniref:Uncharacterized protein n=1 Tax=Thecamonas trahens ATCC 50062 TaxID=461836 RepID=A0A0L0DJ39_THETB|nr:hypothetical protein AMSG_01043 [Thecamonas trahens ATCC 50062]KNC52215.1 hypothetical protein AMSG_01043 [Thecamonas trahens ATCC 50062]|eukprot:XP_013762218.1 hypothetical protein AMSG_01043 [Thecamonas trahens ATCC 50062]